MSRPLKENQITDSQILEEIKQFPDINCTILSETFGYHRSAMHKRIVKLSERGIIEPLKGKRKGAIKLVV